MRSRMEPAALTRFVVLIVFWPLLAVPAVLTAQAATPSRPIQTPRGWRTVNDTQCGIVVRVPPGWTVQTVKWEFGTDAECAVGLRPADWLDRRARSEDEVAEFALYIGLSTGTLDGSCDKGIVCRDAKGWYFEGRAGARSDGHEMRTPMGPGVRGETETGVYAKNDGGYSGAATALVAVVSRAPRLAQFIADHYFDDAKVFDRIVQACEFKGR